MKNKLYKVSVPVTVWVASYVRAHNEKEAIEKIEDEEFDLVLYTDPHTYISCVSFGSDFGNIEDPDYDKMQVEPVEDLAI